MRAIVALRALGSIDVKNVRRDPMLRWLVLFPLLIVAAGRWGVPPLARWLLAEHGFDLVPLYPLVASSIVLAIPQITGMVIGFLLLDQRDDGTLLALQVTPLSLRGYLIYRISLPIGLSVILSLLTIPWLGLAGLPPGPLSAAVVGAAPLAPLYALFLAGFAANKVQGFALAKGVGVLGIPPVVAWFVPGPWQPLFGLVPLYWPAKAYWVAQSGGGGQWIWAAIGIVYQALLLRLLLRRYDSVMHR